MFFIRYWYVRAKLALAPNRYTPAEKVALAHEDIDVAKTIILDQAKRVDQRNPQNSLTHSQLVEILQRIYNEDHPLLKDSLKFKKSFWGKLDALNQAAAFPTYESLIPEYDANNLETNKKISESLVEMGLLDLKTLAPEYKVKLAKNSEELAKKIFFGQSQNPPVKYKENLQPSHRAEIMAHYYAPIPPLAAPVEEIRIVGAPVIAPQKSFWEKLIHNFMSIKFSNFKDKYDQTTARITELDAAIEREKPVSLNNKKSRKADPQGQSATERFNKLKREKEDEKNEAVIDLYNYFDHPNTLIHKTAARSELCTYILLNSSKSVQFFKKNSNDILNSLEQNQEFRKNFIALLKSEDAKHPQADLQPVDSYDVMPPTSLYSEVIKIIDGQLQTLLNNNHNEVRILLTDLTLTDIVNIYKSLQDSKYFDNLLLYISKHRFNEVLPNLDAFVTLLSVVSDEQLSKFLIDNFNKIDIFKLISKLGSNLTNEKYENLVKQLMAKLSAAQIVDMLFRNHKDAAILKFLGNARDSIKDNNAFNSIVFELFNKYDPSKLLELITSCQNNDQQLSAIKSYLNIVEQQTKQPVIDTDYTDVAKFFMTNQLVAQFFNIQLKPEQILKAALNAANTADDEFINKHSSTIVDAATADLTTANCLNSHEKLANLLIDYATVIDFPVQNIDEAQKFFRSIESYKEGGIRSYFLINLELKEENLAKAAKLLNCQPEKLQNALLIFTDPKWKDSFIARLISYGISFESPEEIDAQYTRPPFNENNRFVEIMATPKNVIVPLPDPTKIYSIYALLHDNLQRQKLVFEAPFSKAAHEAKRIIDSVMNLGKTIADKIRKITGVTELLAIKFAPSPAANANSSTPTKSAVPAAVTQHHVAGKDKEEKEKKEKKAPVSTLSPPAVANQKSVNITPSKPASDNAPTSTIVNGATGSPSVPPVTESAGHQAAPIKADAVQLTSPATANPKVGANGTPQGVTGIATASPNKDAAEKPLTTLANGRPLNSPAVTKDSISAAPQATSDLDLENLENIADELDKIVKHMPSQAGSSQQAASLTTPVKELDSVPVAASSPAVTTPAAATPPSSGEKHLRGSLKQNQSPVVPSDSEVKDLQIPEEYNLSQTKKWLDKNRKQKNALSIALKHIKEHIILKFDFNAKSQIKELHYFLADLTENELASFLLLNRENGEQNQVASKNAALLYQLSIFNTGIIGNEYGKILLKAAKQNIELASMLLNHEKITADFKQKLLNEFSIQQHYKLLNLCWSNGIAKNFILTHIEQKTIKRPTALSSDESSLAQKLFSQPEIAKKILREKLVESVINMGSEFINNHFLHILKLVLSDQKDANEFFAKYALTNEDIEKLNPQFDTHYLPLKSNYQSFFNETNILKQPYSVFKLVFDDVKLAKAAMYFKCSPEQLSNAYFLFPNDELRNQFFKELDSADIKINTDYISLELLKNDPTVDKQQLVTGEDKLSRHLGADECSVIVPFPHSNELIALNQYAKILKFAGDSINKFNKKIKSFADNLVQTAKLGSELVVAIFGNNESNIDSIERKRLSILPTEIQRELMVKAESLGARSYRSSNSFGRSSPEKPKTLLAPQPLTHEEFGLRGEELEKAKTGGASAAINILMGQTKFNNIQILEIITQFSDINSDDPKIKSEHQLFVSQLKNPKLWSNPAMVDVYTLALGYKDSRLQSAAQKLQRCLALVIGCPNPLAFVSKAQLDDLINTYINTFGNVADDYRILGLNSNTATLKDIKKAYGKLSVTEHPDKHNNDELAKRKFNAIEEAHKRLSAIASAKEKLTNKNIPQEKDPSLGDWGTYTDGSTRSTLFATAPSSSASASLNSSMSSVASVNGGSPGEVPAAADDAEKRSSPRPNVSNVDQPD